MAELVARGEAQEQQWRRSLSEGQPVVLGRDPQCWAVAWEHWLSRRHAELLYDNGKLRVRQLPDAHNPIFFHGEQATDFSLAAGEAFVIGRTTFTLGSGPATASSTDEKQVIQSYTVSAEELHRLPFRDAPQRIDVLGHLTKLIFSVADEAELFAQTTNLLFEGIRKAEGIAVVAVDEDDHPGAVRILHADRRLAIDGEFRPSTRLVREAIEKQKSSVVHVWAGAPAGVVEPFTVQGNFDWAFCTPLRGDTSSGMGLYVAGRLLEAEPSALLAPWETNDLRDDLKFAELVADMLSALRHTQALQRRQSVLGHFFSPSVMKVLLTKDPETALRPRETDVTVLFCDLRGFSREVELAVDNLPAILERVSAALGVMSNCILQQKGVVADFLGDAAMGFWGWPLAAADDVQQACLAALGIQAMFERFAREPNHPLANFRAGVGIATGHAIAGQIGTRDQTKVTVFGPAVNLASRLEGLTKILRVPILIDETTARFVAEKMPRTVARCRRLARVKPYGLATPVILSELLPPATLDALLSDQAIHDYEVALDAFLAGRWDEAYNALHLVPPQDLGKDFLTTYILQHNHLPPPNFDGVISIESKG
ncbi:MAG TPA: adenylate/guanylate cyclase domain-containing protein [Pirellulales bacterium]|nr:adenylate/guanylate cyclase domain-containing protein [Pirellulales bacterium]